MMSPRPDAWRVESDGRAHQTKIYDGQGNLVPLDGVVAIRWEISAGTIGQLTIVAEASIDVTGEEAPAVQPPTQRGHSEKVVA